MLEAQYKIYGVLCNLIKDKNFFGKLDSYKKNVFCFSIAEDSIFFRITRCTRRHGESSIKVKIVCMHYEPFYLYINNEHVGTTEFNLFCECEKVFKKIDNLDNNKELCTDRLLEIILKTLE